MSNFEYIKWYVKEFHGEFAPILLYEVDLDNDRYATRIIEIYENRQIKRIVEEDFKYVSEGSIPTIQEINLDYPEHYAELITREQFEVIYKSEYYNGKIEFPDLW